MQALATASRSNVIPLPEQETPQLQIPERCWEPVAFTGADATVPSQLLAKVLLNHCPMHFEAYLVGDDGDLVSEVHHRSLQGVRAALQDDEDWRTISYAGRSYVVLAIPYGR